MRLIRMPRRLALAAALASLLTFAGAAAVSAQTSLPPGQVSPFKDTSPVKAPPGAKVAIFDFEDLECPACARAFPFTHMVISKYKIPLVRHDFPLAMHIWSHDAADYARYMQDTISPEFAEDYRRQVFASQAAIASKDDMVKFTRKFLTSRGKQMPFVVDQKYKDEVNADYALGVKVGLVETPTIFVVTDKGSWVQVKDSTLIEEAVVKALKETGGAPPAAKPAAKAPVKK